MIRDVEPSDLPGIAKLLKSLGYNTTQHSLESKLSAYQHTDEYKVMIEVEDDGTITGVIGLHAINIFHTKLKLGRVMSLIFDESYRGNRAGRALIDAADDFFISQGCQQVEVAGGIVHSTARKLFLTMGFREADRQFLKPLKSR